MVVIALDPDHVQVAVVVVAFMCLAALSQHATPQAVVA
jgi:hypothetical protein